MDCPNTRSRTPRDLVRRALEAGIEAAHPVPSARNVEGATELLHLADDADEETLVLCVVTGGGSTLLAAPAGAVSLDAIQQLTEALLASGASIEEINTVRKYLSELKGGRLARRLAPATTVGILFSDVTSNDPSIIASGPLAPDESTFERASSILDGYSISPPESVDRHLQAGVAGDRPETPAGDDPAFRDVETILLSSSIRGEAREAAKTHAAITEEIVATGNPVELPAAVVSGGETTVTLSGDGAGGPNQEFALGAALELPAGVVLGAVDTDGIDGSTTAAGAIVTAETADPADAARDALARHDSFPFLDRREATVETGPTGTNVNDLCVLFVPGADADCPF
jgi:glycerate 2-kinase